MFGSQHICDVWKSTEQSIHPSIHQILILGWVVGGTTIKRPPNFAVSLATSFLLWLGFPQSQASVEIESPPMSFACLPACLPARLRTGRACQKHLPRKVCWRQQGLVALLRVPQRLWSFSACLSRRHIFHSCYFGHDPSLMAMGNRRN